MQKVGEIAKTGSAVIALITATLTLAGWINQSYVDYLDTHFASKSDLTRLEQKIDKLTDFVERVHGQRK